MKWRHKTIWVGILLLEGSWGFFVHQRINRLAVFTLPPEMAVFYKAHLQYISETAVAPDRRRYLVPEEGARHYIDLDHYEPDSVPEGWVKAVEKYSEDTLQAHGILPWYIPMVVQRLESAFATRQTALILKLSAELGHYVGDAHVPLHATHNYDGQRTGQQGLHALWESRLPELFADEYDFFVGRAEYIPDVRKCAWNIIRDSHALVDSVLTLERAVAASGLARYTYDTKGKQTVRLVAWPYARRYHDTMHGMVERRWRSSIHITASLWYTAWVNAGQPDLDLLQGGQPEREDLETLKNTIWELRRARFQPRGHESDSLLH